MRILHISTRLILGGSQENTVLSCEGQARLGHEVHLAFGPIYGPEGSLLERVQAFNARCETGSERTRDKQPCRPITTHVVPDMIRAIHPWRDWKATRQLEELIREIQPDVVHTHSSKAGVIGRAAGWKVQSSKQQSSKAAQEEGKTGSGSPLGVVHTIHGPPFHPYQRRLVHDLYVASEKWAAKRCHVIVSVADAMTKQYLDAGIGLPEQYVTVYSGMETARFLTPEPGESRDEVRSRLGIAESRFVIGTVARLAELKGHDDLLDALGEELRRRPEWLLLWVGDGWWRDRLLTRVREMGLAGRVITTGLVPPEKVAGMMRAMDVLVHPSYREGLPRTVPQALLCGTPVAASDVDGTREACIDNVTGKLFKPGDKAALRDAVTWLADHPAQRAAMAATGKSLCEKRFSAATMVAELETVYARAIREARKP